MKSDAVMISLIGGRGSGKTTFSDLAANIYYEMYGLSVAVRANIHIASPNVIFETDIMRYLAQKLKKLLETQMNVKAEGRELTLEDIERVCPHELVIIDEAAISGFEARGTGGKDSAIDSYLITLSRKTNSDLIFITQLMSMVEKRGQWLYDFNLLCEAHYETPESRERGYPDYFLYVVYDSNLEETGNEFELSGDAAKSLLFGQFNTYEIPNEEQLIEMLMARFSLTLPEQQSKEFSWKESLGDNNWSYFNSTDEDKLLFCKIGNEKIIRPNHTITPQKLEKILPVFKSRGWNYRESNTRPKRQEFWSKS
jgi:hypothetical protein